MENKKYLLNRREDYRLMNQTGVRQYVFPLDFSHNAIWDSNVSPDGKLFFGLASEIFTCNYVRLCEYEYEKNEIVKHFEVEDVILPNDRTIRASKFHTSIQFVTNDLMIMTTHTTDKSPLHPTWMPYQYYGHIWEGFPGSNIITYDRQTGEAKNLGVPVMRESIYGSVYDPKHHMLYFLGFFRGHLYRYSLDSKRVEDLGKATEGFSFRLTLGPDGNIYSSTRSGYLYRVDTGTGKINDLGYRFPHYSGSYPRQFTNISIGRTGPDGRLYFAVMYAPEIFALDTATGRVESIGGHLPGGVRDYIRGENRCGIFGMDFDSKGRLWYAMSSKNDECGAPETGLPSSLFCWDVLHEREPSWLGLLGTPERVGAWLSEVCISKDDVLYAVGSNHSLDGPDITAVDLNVFAPVMSRKSEKTIQDGFYDPASERYLKSSGMLHKLEKLSEENPPEFKAPVVGAPIRLWRAPELECAEDSCVTELHWDGTGTLRGVCGKRRCYEFEIRGGAIARMAPLEGTTRDAALPVLPGKPCLPCYPGRQYKAESYLFVPFSRNRYIAGTSDGMLAVLDGENVFSLGPAAGNGPVRALTVDAGHSVVYGVAGDDEDMGNVFAYDDKNGLVWLGIINTELPEYSDTACMSLLTACALSPDGAYLAVGSGDRLGTVVIFRVK